MGRTRVLIHTRTQKIKIKKGEWEKVAPQNLFYVVYLCFYRFTRSCVGAAIATPISLGEGVATNNGAMSVETHSYTYAAISGLSPFCFLARANFVQNSNDEVCPFSVSSSEREKKCCFVARAG